MQGAPTCKRNQVPPHPHSAFPQRSLIRADHVTNKEPLNSERGRTLASTQASAAAGRRLGSFPRLVGRVSRLAVCPIRQERSVRARAQCKFFHSVPLSAVPAMRECSERAAAAALLTQPRARSVADCRATMADHLGLASAATIDAILNTLTAIDQRLSRIESVLRIGHPNNVSPAAPVAVVPPPQLQPPPSQQQAMVLNPAGAPNVMTSVAFRPLEPPPEGYTISSRETMQEELDQWTIPRGYSMRIAGAKVSGKRKVRWVCFRGGEARHHRAPVDESVILQAKAEGRRKPTTDRASKKCGCLFKFEVIETSKGTDMWVLHYPNEDHKIHNHPPSDQTSDPRARKLPPFMLEQVDQWLREGWLVSKIQEELKARGFTNVLNTDLYNRKRLLRKEDVQMQG